MRDWIVAFDAGQGSDAYAVKCLRCGEMLRFVVPISLGVWCAAAKEFTREHAKCLPVRETATG